MGIARSTYYDQPTIAVSDTELVETMAEIAETFEAYGYRRMRAALRHRGLVVNHKKIRRLMREHDLQPKARRQFVATTHSDHDLPIFPNLANGMTIDGPNQLWVADLTYVAILAGFVYVAVILDAWSRRVVGYAISRSIDTRLVGSQAQQLAIKFSRTIATRCAENSGSWSSTMHVSGHEPVAAIPHLRSKTNKGHS